MLILVHLHSHVCESAKPPHRPTILRTSLLVQCLPPEPFKTLFHHIYCSYLVRPPVIHTCARRVEHTLMNFRSQSFLIVVNYDPYKELSFPQSIVSLTIQWVLYYTTFGCWISFPRHLLFSSFPSSSV